MYRYPGNIYNWAKIPGLSGCEKAVFKGGSIKWVPCDEACKDDGSSSDASFDPALYEPYEPYDVPDIMDDYDMPDVPFPEFPKTPLDYGRDIIFSCFGSALIGEAATKSLAAGGVAAGAATTSAAWKALGTKYVPILGWASTGDSIYRYGLLICI